ncbi:MAG: hypothetical protein MJ054_00775 [Clostridia bacterium]|nr:hypothetical protein [Clostridia bacterium]
MNLEAGNCPKCHEYLLLKQNTPFLICPKCGETISAQAANAIVESRCQDASQVNAIIAECVALEIKYGPELPYMLLSKIVTNFPHLEKPAYLLVKLSGFESGLVYEYLKTFAGTKSEPINVPWAESFLDNCIDYTMIDAADLLRSYVRNKVRKEKQSHYLDLIDQLVKEYTSKTDKPNSTKWLMAIYTISSVINIALFPLMMILSGWLSQIFHMYFIVNILIGLGVISLEVLMIFIHHKIYGNRFNISQTERLWMVIFMSTMVFAVGAVVMGSIWKITF